MSGIADEQTPDLHEIGAQLSRAIRRDDRSRVRRGAVARMSAIVLAASTVTSGVALAAGQLTGAIDIGGGHTATPVQSIPAPTDPKLPYRYQVLGTHIHDGQAGTIYIESDRPLRNLTQAELAAIRHGCAPDTLSVDGATVWVFDTVCAPGQR
jgi:hypothetical protein